MQSASLHVDCFAGDGGPSNLNSTWLAQWVDARISAQDQQHTIVSTVPHYAENGAKKSRETTHHSGHNFSHRKSSSPLNTQHPVIHSTRDQILRSDEYKILPIPKSDQGKHLASLDIQKPAPRPIVEESNVVNENDSINVLTSLPPTEEFSKTGPIPCTSLNKISPSITSESVTATPSLFSPVSVSPAMKCSSSIQW